jgi:hypothetical protein
MFRDYEHRGEVFKAAVKNLIGRTDPRAQGKEIDIS